MKSADLYIQCTHNGLTGTFLRDDAGELLSPVFADSVDAYRFIEARGWTRDPLLGAHGYSRDDDAPAMVAVADLQPGDMLDLQGDPVADREGDPGLEFELAVVETIERETPDCVVVYSSLINCGFAPDHKVKVMGFEGRMVEAVTGEPARLVIARPG